MAHQELNARIEHYNEARKAGRITGHEWKAFMAALAKLAREGR
jgi:hypothetical protein